MEEIKHDIESEEDIKLLIDSFYSRVLTDPVIGHIFTEIARIDLEKHLPKLYAFWNMLLLGSPGYHGQPLTPHIPLGLKTEHFTRWLKLFEETVREHFKGMNAELAIQKATNIGKLWAHKLTE